MTSSSSGGWADKSSVAITISSTSTTYVYSSAIPVKSFEYFTIIPEVTTNVSGKTIYYKVQFSFDGTNWTDYTVDVAGTASAAESLISQASEVRAVDATSTGYKAISNGAWRARAPYMRIGRKSGDASTLVASYHVGAR